MVYSRKTEDARLRCEQLMTRYIKEEIENRGLIDTGLLIETIQIHINLEPDGGLDVSATAPDYWKYVRTDIVEVVYALPAVDKALHDLLTSVFMDTMGF